MQAIIYKIKINLKAKSPFSILCTFEGRGWIGQGDRHFYLKLTA